MTSFDYFYENILIPICETVSETVLELVTALLEWTLVLVYFVTVPFWIVPYALIRHSRRKKTDGHIKNS